MVCELANQVLVQQIENPAALALEVWRRINGLVLGRKSADLVAEDAWTR